MTQTAGFAFLLLGRGTTSRVIHVKFLGLARLEILESSTVQKEKQEKTRLFLK